MSFILKFDDLSGSVVSLSLVELEMVFPLDFNSVQIKSIGAYACTKGKVQKVDLSNTKITSIGLNAFSYTRKLKVLILPTTLTTIENNAFVECCIDEINIPASVTTMTGYAWNQNTGETIFYVDENNAHFSSFDGCLFNKEKTAILRCKRDVFTSGDVPLLSSLRTIGHFSFTTTNLMSIVCSQNLTEIEIWSFHAMGKMQLIDLSHTKITSIPMNSFCQCSVVRICLPITVNSLKQNSFYGAISLVSIVLNKEVIVVEARAFENCPNLRRIYYFGSSTSLQNVEMFYGTTQNSTIEIYVTEDYTPILFGKLKVIRNWYNKVRLTCKIHRNRQCIKSSFLLLVLFSSQ